jgi:hypothetical protein
MAQRSETPLTTEPPEGYVIDVCARCGRLAAFPFPCGHRTDRGPWTIPLAVKATQAGRTALRDAMSRATVPGNG